MFDTSKPLALSDGTPVEFVKETSNGNVQVRLPYDHALAQTDPLRIFRPDGSHYKDRTQLTLVQGEAEFAEVEPAGEVADGKAGEQLVRGELTPTEDAPLPAPKGPSFADVAASVAAPPATGTITYIDLGADGKFGLFRLPG